MCISCNEAKNVKKVIFEEIFFFKLDQCCFSHQYVNLSCSMYTNILGEETDVWLNESTKCFCLSFSNEKLQCTRLNYFFGWCSFLWKDQVLLHNCFFFLINIILCNFHFWLFAWYIDVLCEHLLAIHVSMSVMSYL